MNVAEWTVAVVIAGGNEGGYTGAPIWICARRRERLDPDDAVQHNVTGTHARPGHRPSEALRGCRIRL